MRPRHWVIGAAVVLLAALSLPLFQRTTDRYQNTHLSIHRARSVIEASVTYRQVAAAGGKYPASLDDLLRPAFGGRPLLEGADRDTIDGWGHRLRYAVVVNEKGEGEAYAWAERTVNGKTHLCGAKGTADGTVVLFGLPE